MRGSDQKPQQSQNLSAWKKINAKFDNRLGAVYSALYTFWTAQASNGIRADAYSVIMFHASSHFCVVNDEHSSPDQLLDECLRYEPSRGTNFDAALEAAKDIMCTSWTSTRYL